MFKNLKKMIMLLIFTFMLTGCMQYDLSMEINEDKSMEFVLIQTTEQSLLNEDGTINNQGFGGATLLPTIIDLNELKKIFIQKGYKVVPYKDPSRPTNEGAKITKHFEDIDKISKENEVVEVDFTAITQDIFDDSYFFTVQKGLVYNVYKGNFIIMNESNVLDPSYSSYLHIKYTLKLPENTYVESNATSISEDKRTITWDLDASTPNKINFTFKMANKDNLVLAYICIGIIVLIIIIGSVVAIKNQKKKKKLIEAIMEKRKQEEAAQTAAIQQVTPNPQMTTSPQTTENANTTTLTTSTGVDLMAPQSTIPNQVNNNMPPMQVNTMQVAQNTINTMPPVAQTPANNMPPMEANINNNFTTQPKQEELMPNLNVQNMNMPAPSVQSTEPLRQEQIVPTIVKPVDTSVIGYDPNNQVIQNTVTNVVNQPNPMPQLTNIPDQDPGIVNEIPKPTVGMVTNNNETVISQIVTEPTIDQNKGQ